MSKAGVEQVIGRLVVDRRFRESFAADARQTLADFDLSEEEREKFLQVDLAGTEGLTVEALGQRLSKKFTGYCFCCGPKETEGADRQRDADRAPEPAPASAGAGA
jgi:hypothetical protein